MKVDLVLNPLNFINLRTTNILGDRNGQARKRKREEKNTVIKKKQLSKQPNKKDSKEF